MVVYMIAPFLMVGRSIEGTRGQQVLGLYEGLGRRLLVFQLVEVGVHLALLIGFLDSPG